MANVAPQAQVLETLSDPEGFFDAVFFVDFAAVVEEVLTIGTLPSILCFLFLQLPFGPAGLTARGSNSLFRFFPLSSLLAFFGRDVPFDLASFRGRNPSNLRNFRLSLNSAFLAGVWFIGLGAPWQLLL